MDDHRLIERTAQSPARPRFAVIPCCSNVILRRQCLLALRRNHRQINRPGKMLHRRFSEFAMAQRPPIERSLLRRRGAKRIILIGNASPTAALVRTVGIRIRGGPAYSRDGWASAGSGVPKAAARALSCWFTTAPPPRDCCSRLAIVPISHGADRGKLITDHPAPESGQFLAHGQSLVLRNGRPLARVLFLSKPAP